MTGQRSSHEESPGVVRAPQERPARVPGRRLRLAQEIHRHR